MARLATKREEAAMGRPSADKNDNDVEARARILRAAHTIFMEKGPERATVREIIGLARSSNATLVKYFGSKDGLFASYVEEFGTSLSIAAKVEPDEGPEQALANVGTHILKVVIPEIRSYRTAMATINKNPAIGPLIMENSEGPIIACLAPALQRWSQDGLINSVNPAADAARFVQLLKAGAWERILFARQDTAAEEEIEDAVSAAVRIFLYGISRSEATVGTSG